MAIIVEDGTGVTGATTYASEADLTAYADDRGIILSGLKSELLLNAMDWLELRPFKGNKADPDQPLEFPRNDATIVPAKIKTAQMVAALIYDAGGNPMAAIGPRVTQESVAGAVSVSYSSTGNQSTLYPQLSALLRDFVGNAGGSSFEVGRG